MAEKKKKPEFTEPEKYTAPTYQPTEIAPLALETYKPSATVTAAQQRAAEYAAQNPAGGQWQTSAQNLLQRYLDRGKFEYDLESDPLYASYRDQYVREGKNAMRDTQAEASVLSGGYGNSYGVTAGAQAYQSYLDRLNDRVPELYDAAYDRWRDEGADLYNQYNAAQGYYQSLLDDYYQRQNYLDTQAQQAYQNDYNEYGDRNANARALYDAAVDREQINRANYESDRNFGYQTYSDDYTRAYDRYLGNMSNYYNDLDRERQARLDERAIYESDRAFNYQARLDERAIYESDRAFNYQAQQDSIANSQAWARIKQSAQSGQSVPENTKNVLKDLGFSDASKMYAGLRDMYDDGGVEAVYNFVGQILDPSTYSDEDVMQIAQSVADTVEEEKETSKIPSNPVVDAILKQMRWMLK